MNKIRKYQFMAFLEVFEAKGCKTIEDIKNLLNKDLKQDMNIVFQWSEFRYQRSKEEIKKAIIEEMLKDESR